MDDALTEDVRSLSGGAGTVTSPRLLPQQGALRGALNPSGLCMCGCGQPAPIAKKTSTAAGHVKGEPVRYIQGHRLKCLTPEQRQRSVDKRTGKGNGMYGRSAMLGRVGELSHAWKGNDASYGSIHEWMRKHFPKTGVCEQCGKVGRTDWANVDHKYRRVLEDWRELCKSCHAKTDNWASRFTKSA